MIISVSRRTDIPALYMDWFTKRLSEGFVLVRNPFNAHQVSRIPLTEDVLDGIVFWSKNPKPLLSHLPSIRPYAHYLHFTLTGYGRDVEPNLPPKKDLVHTFAALADAMGSEHVIWRYDPIFVGRGYDIPYHLRAFERLSRLLEGCTRICHVSFMDFYSCTRRAMCSLEPRELSALEKEDMICSLSEIAGAHSIELRVCAEEMDLGRCGVSTSCCVDATLLESQLGCRLAVSKDSGQRSGCRCMQSVDIGAYATCSNGCRYCYANHSPSKVERGCAQHDPLSPLLTGVLGPLDRVKVREVRSLRQGACQLGFWDQVSGETGEPAGKFR